MSDPFHFDDDLPALRLVYAGAALLFLIPFLQAGQQLLPPQLGNIRWRYGAANALSGVLLLPFIGLSLAVLVARRAEHVVVSRVIGALSAVLAVGLLGSLALFVLDAMELKSIITSQMMTAFQATTARVALVTLTFAGAFAMLTLVALKEPRLPQRARRAARRTNDGVGLIVGQESAATAE